MNNYKIVFIDIDGTLRNKKGIITNENINTIKKLKELGIIVVITSGRNLGHTIEISKKCGASNYIISSSGSQIYDYHKNDYIWKKTIDKNDLIDLYSIFSKYNLNILIQDGSLSVDSLKYSNDEISFDEFINNKDIYQCAFTSYDISTMIKVKEEIDKLNNMTIKDSNINYKIIPKINFAYYDIAPSLVSKGYAIKKLCEHLNIDLKDSIAIGDGINDISMFEVVGLSVAMGNSTDYVKKKADIITLDTDNNGVSYILKDIFKL